MSGIPIELPIYGGIATALLTCIGVLWKKLEASEQRERALYREIMRDSEALETISQHMAAREAREREHTDLLKLIASRLESLAVFSSRSGETQTRA